MRRIFCWIFLLACTSSPLLADDSIPEIRLFSFNKLGELIALQGDELIHFDAQGKVQHRYSRHDLGKPDLIDAGNPLRIFVFYKAFASVRVLDKQLSEQGTINLRAFDIRDPLTIAASPDGGFWVYDGSTAQLIRLDEHFRPAGLAADLRQYLGSEPAVEELLVTDNWMVLLCRDIALVLDRFGTPSRKIPLTCKPLLFQVNEAKLYLGCEEESSIWDLQKPGAPPMTGPKIAAGTSKAAFTAGKVHILRGGWLQFP